MPAPRSSHMIQEHRSISCKLPLAHSKWDCKYHVVFVPKRRRKTIFGNIRRQLGPVFHALAQQKECQILEGVQLFCIS